MNKENKSYIYVIISVITIIAFFLIWYLLTDVFAVVDTQALPSPVTVIKTFITKLTDTRPDGSTLIQHTWASLKLAFSGFVVGALIGVPLGICMAWFTNFDKFVTPLFDMIRSIPGVAWVPLTIVFFGIGFTSKLTVIIMSVFVSCVVNSYSGIKQTKDVHLWTVQTFGGSRTQALFKVAIPSALPMIFVGLKVALASAWSAIIAAEMIASTEGLGYMIQQNRGIYRVDVIIAGMLAIGLVGSVLTAIINAIEKQLLKGRAIKK